MRRKQGRNPYEKPKLTKLTQEQATGKLVPHAEKGNAGARELLKSLPWKDSEGKKKSA
jgi:hypothetical protein